MTTPTENIVLSNTNLFLFKSDLTNGKEIRVVGTSENPLFIGKDIAEILGYKNTRDALIKHVKPNHKKTLNSNVANHDSLNLRVDTVLIDEAGLYSLVLRSKMKEAEMFQEWVISEVLPSIRKSGQYKLEQELLLKDEIIKTITTDHNTLVSDHQLLQKNHNNILKRRNRTDFESGNVVYIVSHEAFNLTYNTTFHKIGKSTQKKGEKSACFKQRLSTYNTGAPVNFKVHYLLYVEDNDFIEKSLKISYAKNLDPSNKEWIKDVKLIDIIEFLRKFCVFLKIDCKEVMFENTDLESVKIEPKVMEIVEEELEDGTEIIEVEEKIEVEEMRNSLIGSLQAYTQAIPQIATQGGDPSEIVIKIADVIKARQKGVAIEDAIEQIFKPQELPPAGAPQVEQMSPAPSAPAGGPLPSPEQGGGLQSLLSSLTAGGQASASARTVVRR